MKSKTKIFLNQWKLNFRSDVTLSAQHDKWKTATKTNKTQDILSPIILNLFKKNKGKLEAFLHMESFKNLSLSHPFLGSFWRCAHQN